MRANQLKTIDDCLKAIELIEMNPANILGGHAAFFSGRPTELTKAAKDKVDALNRQIERLGNILPDC